MTASTKWFGKGGMHVAHGDIIWDTDPIKVALVTSTYVPDQANHEFFSDVTNELAATGGYTLGGDALAGKARSFDVATKESRLTANNLTFAALTPSAAFRYAIIYKSTGVAGTSILLAYIDFGSDQNPAGSDFVITWPVTGVAYLQAA